MKHLIEITLISLILLGLAFCFGCKDEVDYEPIIFTSEPEPNEPQLVIDIP